MIIAARTRSALCFVSLLWLALLSCACEIDLSKASFSCRDGSPCPPGYVCGPRLVCVAETSELVITPGAGAAAKGGNGSGGIAGTSVREDAAVPDAGRSPDGGDVDSGRTCSPACTGELPICDLGACVECIMGAGRCEGAQPFRCSAERRWEAKDVCGGDEPVCNNGDCAAVQAVGGFVTVTSPGVSANGLVLVEHALIAMPALCGDVDGNQICAYGAIVP